MKQKRFLTLVLALLLSVASLVQPSAAAGPVKTRAIMVWGLYTANGDIENFCKNAAANGINAVRFFVNYLEDDNAIRPTVCPFDTIGWWNPEHIAYGDAGHDVPVRDLSRRNAAWVSKTEQLAGLMAKYGLLPWIVFEDQCSQEDGNWKQFNDPYYGSAQLHYRWQQGSLDRAFAGGNQARELDPFRASLERDTLAIFRAAGCDVVWGEPFNEYGAPEGPAFPESESLAWFQRRTQSLRELGYDIVVGSARPPILTKIAGFVDLYDQHCIVKHADIAAAATGLPASRVIINTDGGDGAGAVSAFGGHSLSEAQATSLGQAVLAGGYPAWCFMVQESQGADLDGPCDVDPIFWPALRAMAEASGWPPLPPPVEQITVSICTASDLRSNPYCRTIEMRTFKKGEEPTAVCPVHKAPAPPKKGWLSRLLEWLFGRLF